MSEASFLDSDGVTRFSGTLVGGPASSPVALARVVIQHPTIITLPSQAVPLVPAPAAGRALWPVGAFFEADTTAGVYTGIDAGCLLSLNPDNAFSAYSLASQLFEGAGQVSALLAAGARAVATVGPAGVAPASLAPADTFGSSHGQDPAGYDGLPLLLGMDNGGSADPLDDGNVANTLTVTVLYAVVTL